MIQIISMAHFARTGVPCLYNVSIKEQTKELIVHMANIVEKGGDALKSAIQTHIQESHKSLAMAQTKCKAITEMDKPVEETAPFVVSFVGRFKTGKSSLINTLLGTDILPTRATTATTIVTRIVYGSEIHAYFREHGKLKTITVSEARHIILNYAVSEPDYAPEVIFELPVEWLKGNIELRDTPGMDDSAQNGALEKVALNAIIDTDLCVFVYDASQFISGRELKLTEEIHRKLGGNIVFAINRTNSLNSVEGLNQVENMAKHVLCNFGNSMIGKCRYYLMCSAPNMASLDGFDIWLSELLSSKSRTRQSKLRKQAVAATAQVVFDDVSGDLDVIQKNTAQYLDLLRVEHEKRIDQKRRGIRESGRNMKAAIHLDQVTANNAFASVNGLTEYLKAERGKSTDSYEQFSKKAVRNFYVQRFNSEVVRRHNYITANDSQFILEAIEGLIFPGISLVQLKASGSSRAAAGIFAGLIGMLGGPIVAAAAASIAAAAVSGDQEDHSEDNTVRYVQENVLPALRLGINSVFGKAIQAADKSVSDLCGQACSDLENEMSALNTLDDSVMKYRASALMGVMSKLAAQAM